MGIVVNGPSDWAFLFLSGGILARLPKVPNNLKDIFSPNEWNALDAIDRNFLASASWQDSSNFSTNALSSEQIINFNAAAVDESKPQDSSWRNLQALTYTKYKTFGPLNAAVNSKADYVAEAGFSIYSDILEVNEFLKELNYSYRNRLYSSYIDWMIRMLAESEIFVLIALDETGTSTVRNLEPNRIGEGDDTGLITDPDDVTQTILYKYKAKDKIEVIPDVRFILEPEYMAERLKLINGEYKPEDISPLTKGKGIKGNFKNIGGFRRFILHWKNLTGTRNIKRDVTSLVTTIEWINYYEKAIKWQLDYLRALSSYTINIVFTDTPAGKIAWHVWNKMTDEQKAKTNLTKPLSPGSRMFLMPGMTLEVKAPQLQGMHGSNQELLNLSGAGARTPQDMYQGQSANSSYSSIKTSRPPLIAEIENLQSKFEKFLRYEFLRACFKAKIAMGGNFISLDGKTKYKLLDMHQVNDIKEVKNGRATYRKINVEPVDERVVKFTFPQVRLQEDSEGKANLAYGSKHTGLYGAGISGDTLAKRMGIDDFSREKKKQLLEHEEFGIPISGSEVPAPPPSNNPNTPKGG